MPIFDLRCSVCDWKRDDTLVRGTLPSCPECGKETVKEWRTSFPNVIDDSIPGGMVIENITKTPITVYSKSEHRLVMKQYGVSQKVRHIGERGSDKSPHTVRWI